MSRLLYRTVALAAALLAAARTVNAETVALGSFAHVDLERNDPDTGASIATLLQAALGETPGRTFVERQEAQKLMDELGLAALGESDPESASRIGKLLRADVMLTGTFVTPEGGKPFIVLETTELARAEPLGQARVELDRVLERGRLAVPGRDDMAKIAADPEYEKALHIRGFEAQSTTPEQLAAFLESNYLQVKPVIERLGLQVD